MAHPFPISLHNFGVRATGAVASECAGRAEVLASPRNQAAAELPHSLFIAHPLLGNWQLPHIPQTAILLSSLVENGQ